MKIHPIADIFPLMSADEFERFCADISANGLREEIWTFEDAIIDGRNRYNACLREGIEPRFREWSGEGDLTAFVVSLNLHRRHLSESQRAMVAAKIANLHDGQTKQGASIDAPVSQTDAAELLNVSRASVQRAKTVLETGVSELAEKVETGEISVHQASQIAALPKAKQIRLIRKGRDKGRKILDELKTKSLKKTFKKYKFGCLRCDPNAVATKESVSADMQMLAKRHPAFARYFLAVTDELEELELSNEVLEAKDKIFAAIHAGYQTFHQIVSKTKLDPKLIEYSLANFTDYGELVAVKQGGETEVARGARKILYQIVEENEYV